jgi:hypothetical protein
MARSAEKLFEWPLCGVAERKRRCSKKRCKFAHAAGELGIDRVGGRCRRGGVVRFVENEHGAGAMLVEPVAQGRGVLFVAQQGVGDDELRMRGPGVDRVTAFAAAIEEIVPVENYETQSEAGLHFALPLGDEGGRAGDDDTLDLLAHDHFAENETGLDGFAEANVVGDKEIDARHLESLLERLQLVGHDLDAGAMRRLEKARVGGGYEVPPKRAEISGEDVRRVEPFAGEVLPVGFGQDLGVRLALPEYGEVLALGVVFQAGKIDESLFPDGITGGFDSFYQISAAANFYDLAK